MNISFLENELVNYHDKEILNYFRYGWYIVLIQEVTQSKRFPNHSSANKYPVGMDTYFRQEILEGNMLGPFKTNPFSSPIFISPLCTVYKKDSIECRVITDLSYPKGNSINDLIPKGKYLGEPTNLTYPRVDDLVDIIKTKGRGCLLFKRDLRKAY